MATTANFGSPVPLSEIEAVLAWVDTFKLSRPTKKINRDFSDAVLLAEILAVHYPKLVEMHNYPPRNSHSLKLNNWMTLNRKVLKKLKLNLCVDTMEQLSNSAPGVIERVLIMVRDKIRRDEEQNKTTKDAEQNVSSGGSYYEACGDDENVLVVPVKKRVNGVLETIQQKVVSHDVFLQVKQELKDAKDTSELLKQKVDHLDSLIKLKDERISELQKQLERKQSRRKDLDVASHENLKSLHDSLKLPLQDIDMQLPPETCVPPTPVVEMPAPNAVVKTQSYNILESKIPQPEEKASRPKSQTSAKPTPKVSYAFVAPNTEGETDVTQEKISYGNIPPTKASQQTLPPTKASQQTVPPTKISQQIVPPVQASHENVPQEKTSQERVPQSKVSDENIPPPKVSYTSVPPSKVSYASVPLSRISYPNVTSAKISYANVPQDKISNVDASQPIPKISKAMLSQAKVSHALLSQAKVSNAVLSKISNDEDTIQVENFEDGREELDRIRSDVFKEAELTETEEKNYDAFQDMEEFKDSIQDCTIEGTIEKEIIEIAKPLQNINNDN